MKWVVVLVFLSTGCASTQRTPKESREFKSFEYCRGELWGYMLPLGPREDKSLLTKSLHDPLPLMAVFLHMHSDLAENPARALMLFVEIRSRSSFSIAIPDPSIEVQFENAKAQLYPGKFVVVEQMKTGIERYPYPDYEAKLTDAQSNTWQIKKLNHGDPTSQYDCQRNPN